jgi:hypothetical protein
MHLEIHNLYELESKRARSGLRAELLGSDHSGMCRPLPDIGELGGAVVPAVKADAVGQGTAFGAHETPEQLRLRPEAAIARPCGQQLGAFA